MGGHEPENKELADIQDNKTDDDQPDLETDESSGEKSKIKLDVSMEGFTEATDITTPVEMAQESAPSKRDDFDTSYQISDIPAEFSKYDNKITSPATLHRETLFEITDLEDLTDIEETKEDIFVQHSSRSDQTLVADTSPKVVDTKIKRREKNIDRKFERLSMDLSDTEMNVEKEMFVRVSTQISKEDEEQAARSFDKIMFDNFAEDKSEDWLTHGSEPTPEKEVATDIFGEPDHEALQDKLPKQGTTSPSQPRPASSSFDDEESEPESPRSPSPKVSPGSKSPSPRVSQHNSHHDLPRQSSSPYGESSGASSNGSSRNDLDNMIKNDVAPLMKETDQELLDEIIVKDVPESESSTDPVKKFEETHPSAGIDSIQEDQEDASDSECKDQSLNILALATSTPHKSLDTFSLNKSSSEPSPEMPNQNDIKDEDEKSPVTSGLAAPDSKDSLEVQLYSNCEDLSEHFSGKEESIDDMKHKPETSESEDEKEPTVNESVNYKIEGGKQKRDSFEMVEKTEDLSSINDSITLNKEPNKQLIDSSDDDEYDIVSKTEIDEAKKQEDTKFELKESTKSDEKPRALINIQSASSSDTESEFDNEQSRHSSADHSETSENKDVAEVQDEINEIQDSPVVLRSQKVISQNVLQTEARFSRPSSSDYSDIEHHAENTHDILAPSVKEKINRFNQEPNKAESRPSSSDFSETVEKKTVIESDTDSAVIEDMDMVQSIKDKISKFNTDPIGSTDTEPRYSRPSSSDYSEICEKPKSIDLMKNEVNETEELSKSTESIRDKILKFNLEKESEQETKNCRKFSTESYNMTDEQLKAKERIDEIAEPAESVKMRISKFNLDSTQSSETEPEIEKKHSRPNSSDYSDIQDKRAIFEATISSETEPENDKNKSRPLSSDYSDIYEKHHGIESKIDNTLESKDEINQSVSVKDKISKFSFESKISSDTEPEIEQRNSRPSSSDYSDIQDKKAIFEPQLKNTNKELKSMTSSDTEPEANNRQSRPSSSDYSDHFEKKEIDTKNEDISELTEHTDTVVGLSVKEKISKLNLESATSTETEPRHSRPASSDYSEIFEKETIEESKMEEKRENSTRPTKQDIIKGNKSTTVAPGILQVVVHKAIDLANQDMIGKSDPYVKLNFQGQEFKSKTINNSLAPEWNFSTDLLISEAFDSYINIEVFDEDYGQDNIEGTASISLSEAISNSKKEGIWYSLTGCQTGKIFVSTIFTVMSSSTNNLFKTSEFTEDKAIKDRPYSTSSSEEAVGQDKNHDMHQSSTDSSNSNRKDKSSQEMQRQEAL